MPKLAPVVDDIATVPEGLRDYYTKDDTSGKFILDTDVEQHPGASGLHRKTRELLDEQKKTQQKLKAFEGLDPEAARAALAKQQEAEEARAKAEGKWDEYKAQLNAKHVEETQALEGKLKTREGYIHKLVAENVAQSAIVAADGSPTLLLPHVLRHVKVEEQDGEFVAVVVDAKGNPRIRDAKGDLMTIEDLVAEMKGQDAYAGAFKGTGASGSGAGGSANSGGAAPGAIRTRKDFKSDSEKAAWINQHGFAKYRELPAG